MTRVDLFTPWALLSQLYCAPRHLVFKMALGESPDHVPAARDVLVGALSAAEKFDGGPVERILRRFTGNFRLSRVHTAARSLGRIGSRHRGFDDLEHITGMSRLFRVEATDAFNVEEAVDSLRQFSHIESVTPLYLTAVPFAQRSSEPCSLEEAWVSREQVNAPQAMALEPGDPAVIAAVVDTGVVTHHPELLNRVRPGYDTVQLGDDDLATGLSLVGDKSLVDREPEDEVGHGTSCAVIISAGGVKVPGGVAGACGMLPVRVLGATRAAGHEDPVGVGAIADIDHGVKVAVDLGAKVLNLSFGTPEASLRDGDPRPHEDVVRYALARGCVLIAASGNSGKTERFSPACLDGVIAVGAVDCQDRVTGFTTRGDHVALCAPGERVVTAGLHGYQYATGTSFAAPFVTATAALMMSRALRSSEPIDAETIRELLTTSTRPHAKAQGEGIGSGILDARAALAAVDRWAVESDT